MSTSTTTAGPGITPGPAGQGPGQDPELVAAPQDRRPTRRSWGLPLLLIAPALLVLGVMLAYPLYRLLDLSVREFGLPQQFGQPAAFVGLANFQEILGDPYFWTVLVRTVVFCAVSVALTMAIGMAVALLMVRLGIVLRLLVSVSLLLAWAMPPLAATVVWQWLFDTQYGLVNWALTQLGFDFVGHSWLSNPLSFFAVAGIIVVWMGVPFVAFTLYAGLTQVPQEQLEAAALDGAGAWQRFWYVTLPFVKPLVLILTALSILWDFRVFTQIYVLQRAGGIARDTNLLGVWAYRISIGENRFDIGAAVAIVMVLITLLLTAVYLRQMVKVEDL